MGSAMDDGEKLRQPSSSSSEETEENSSEEDDSGEEEEDRKAFLRRERVQQKNADKPARSSEGGEDDDQSDEEEARAQKGGGDSGTSSASESADRGGSETTSAFEGSLQAVAAKPPTAAVASRGKKEPAAEVVLKPKLKPDASPRKRKEKASKRDRDEQSVLENSPSKRQKDESFDRVPKAGEHVPKGKDSAKAASRVKISAVDRKSDSKRSGHASASVEKSEDLSAQQNSVKKLDTKKAGEKVKNSRKAPKSEETEHATGLSSPAKPKLFTGKDEIVLTSEILRDIQRGTDVPSKETDEYWSKFAERVDGRMEGSWSQEQLCKKLKRMKQRYMGMAEKFKNTGEHKFRNTVDEELYAMWSKMWGDGSAVNADAEDVKNKKSQAASPVKAGKASRNKTAPSLQDVKVVKGEAAARKGVSDSAQSEESNGGSDSPNETRTVSLMGTEAKDTNGENNLLSHSTDVLLRTLCQEIHAILAEVQDSSKKNLKHWQSKAFTAVEMAIKAFADQARYPSAFNMESFDGSGILSKNFDLSDSHLIEGDHILQQEWRELRLKELEVYRQRLELMQRECQLKEDRLKALIHKKK